MSDISLETVYALLEERGKATDRRFDVLEELLKKQNGTITENIRRITATEQAIGKLQTWVALCGGGIGLVGIAAAILQAVR